MNTRQPRRRHDAESMQKWFDRRQQEKLTWRELSKLSEIPLPTLQYWRKRVSSPSTPKELSTFVQVASSEVPRENGAYRVELAGGHCVIVERGFAAKEVEVLLQLLQRC